MRRHWLSQKGTEAILIAAIGLIGTLVGAYFVFRGNTAQLELSIRTTQTAEAKPTLVNISALSPSSTVSPTSTPLPSTATATFIPTHTPTPTETKLPTPTSTLMPGQDFEAGCIDSKYWTPYEGETHPKDTRGCWQLSDWGISAQDGGLLLAADDSTQYSRSIYIAIPDKVDLQFKVRIDRLTTTESSDNNLVFGIGNRDQWLLAGKYLIYRVISPTSPIYALYTSSVAKVGERYFQTYVPGQEQRVVFSINGLLLNIYIDDLQVLGPVTLSPADKEVFWIGFRLPNGGSINAFVSEFRLIEK